MVTTNKPPLVDQIKAFKQSSAFTSGDALSFSIKFTDALSLPGKFNPETYLTASGIAINGVVGIVCPGNGGLCVEALHRGAVSVTAFEPRNVYFKALAKVAEFCEAATGKTYSYDTSRPTLQTAAYDLIIWSEGLDEIRDPAEFFKSVVAGLRPGGTLLIEVAYGAHAALPKNTNSWKPSADNFEATIKGLGNLEIVSKLPGRNQLRSIYTIKNTTAPLAVVPVTTDQPTALEVETPVTPKRRGRKPKQAPPESPPVEPLAN
jgi:SAM-dependent methyltransferase